MAIGKSDQYPEKNHTITLSQKTHIVDCVHKREAFVTRVHHA